MNKEELKKFGYSSLHGHTDLDSNLRFYDAVETVPQVLDFASNNNYNAISFDGHESLASHMKAEQIYHDNPDKYSKFKLILGNEIYLVHKDEMENAENNGDKFKFNHFLLTALDKKGHKFLQKQSSLAWSHWHMYHGSERVPSYYEDIEELMKEYKGHVVGSTACLGGNFSQNILNYEKTHDKTYLQNAKKFVMWGIKVFGKDNFFMELMPSQNPQQLTVNNYALKFSQKLGIGYIITTDAHYIDQSQREVHTALLRSRDQGRDVTAYDTAHLFTLDELFGYFNDDVLTGAFKNIQSIVDRVEDYTFEHTPIIPKSRIPEFKKVSLKDFGLNDDTKYKNIKEFVDSDNKDNQYYIKLILDGINKREIPHNDKYFSRIDLEIGELIKISDKVGQPMSSYFLAEHDFVSLIWDKSIVGPGRGSSACWLTNYLLGLTQADAVKYDLPYYRFLSSERVSENKASQYADIDEDSSGSKRNEIIQHIKDVYGENRVLNMCTFSTVASHNAVLMACRSLNIDNEEANYINTLIPSDGMKEWSIIDAIEGNKKKDKEPNAKLNKEINKYPKLKNIIEGLFGLVVGRSVHASAVIVANDDYTNLNASMKTKNGISVTQFDADYTERAGYIKFDFLSLDAIDRLQSAFDLLLRDKKIEWQGSLKETYDKYFSPNKLDFTSPKMYDMLFNGDVINAFEFSSGTGNKTLRKMNARSFMDLISANSLMRLTGGDMKEMPLDRYIRYRDNPNDWDKDMDKYGLSDKEKQIMHEALGEFGGINSSQESLMELVLRKDFTNYSLLSANKLRKSIAKKDPKKQDEEQVKFYKRAKEVGLRKNFTDYVWNEQIALQKNYSFSLSHGTVYTMILITEMNICYHYGPIYWQTACLSVNANTFGETYDNPDYSKVAKAIGELPHGLVKNPDVNKSTFGFIPDKDHILFGLNAIAGIGKNEIQTIIDNRPYERFGDFIKKNGDAIKEKKMVVLIKSGLFDSLISDRMELMVSYVKYVIKPKKKLTTVQVKKISASIPDEYKKYSDAYLLCQAVKKGTKDKQIQEVFIEHIPSLVEAFEKKNKKDYDTDLWSMDEDSLKVDYKRVKKWLDKFIEPLKDWLKTPEACEIEANQRRSAFWMENCLGNIESWEMDSLNMYTDKNEIEVSRLNELISYHSFNDLLEHPVIKGYNNWHGKQYPIHENTVIAGVVIDKNNNKGIVSLLTPNGVANVRVGRSRFSKYNKKIMEGKGKNRHCVSPSWFEKGTKLICIGFRNQNDFILNKKNSGHDHTMIKMNGYGDQISLDTEK